VAGTKKAIRIMAREKQIFFSRPETQSVQSQIRLSEIHHVLW